MDSSWPVNLIPSQTPWLLKVRQAETVQNLVLGEL